MNEVRKRGWVKNGIIIFLILMLILTFLSNTIMNHGLPEVATASATSGSITARIRGSGTATAVESFDVMATQTRTVQEVRVSLNDEVETGDVLLTLVGDVSEEIDTARAELHELELQLERMLIDTSLQGDYARENRQIQNLREALTDAQRALNNLPSQAALDNAQTAVNNAIAAVASRQTDLDNAQTSLNSALEVLEALEENDDIAPDDPELIAAQEEVARAMEALGTARVALDNAITAQNEAIARRDSIAATLESRPMLEQSVRDAQRALDDAIFDLAQKQKEDQLTAANTNIDVRELRNSIDDKREVLEELEKEGVLSEITAPVSGIVTAINATTGNQTAIDSPLMVIEVVDRGYTVSFSVTTEQSTRVRLGDNAEVDRGWFSWGEEITAVLTGIRNDPQNPAMNRLLEFTVRGDIQGGTQLNITIDQRTENYPIIVPNSSVRSDTNGDFVLVVTSRQSPLGNRFVATRADVNVLASDDVNSAVSGGLFGGEFIITTSTSPINPGMQVRLVDSQ